MTVVCWSHVGQGVHKASCCSDVTRSVGTENRCIEGVLGRFYLAQGKILVCFPPPSDSVFLAVWLQSCSMIERAEPQAC